MSPLAILIDLDGTMMDTLPDLAAASNRMRSDFGLEPLPARKIGAFVGKGVDVLIHRALTGRLDGTVGEADLHRGRASFYRHYHRVNGAGTVVFGQVREALTWMQSLGWRLACVTNKPREFTLPLLERLQLAGHFAAVVAGDDVDRPKPDPALLLMACRDLGIEPAGAWMIGDSINDAQAAAAAGMPAVLVGTGYNEGTPVETLRHGPGVLAVVPDLLAAARFIAGRAATP